MSKHIHLILIIGLLCSACTVARFVKWNFANIDDHKRFINAPVHHDPEADFLFKPSKGDSVIFPKLQINKRRFTIEEGLDKSNTVAFLILRNDTLLYERYFNKYDNDSWVNSFSVTKSFVSTLVGIAIAEGYIGSVEDPIGQYVPELTGDLAKVSLKLLLEMRSGIDYNESYFTPFSDAAIDYYGRNIKRRYAKFDLKVKPDSLFQYRSGNTQLLAEAVERATGKKLTEYLEEKLWKPMGMESPASWSFDHKKDSTIKAFCCLNATARDFAKLGLLFLNNGKWEDKQLVPESWIKEATTYDRPKNNFVYTYQWWTNRSYDSLGKVGFTPPVLHDTVRNGKVQYIRYPDEDFFAEGHLGQFIYVNPLQRIVIVRLGKNYGRVKPDWNEYMQWIARKNGVRKESL